MYLLMTALILLSISVVSAEEMPANDFLEWNKVSSKNLDSSRGMGTCTSGCQLGTMTATSSGNSSSNSPITGNNSIGNDSFHGAAGGFIVVQNIGNNVIIQTQMNISVTEIGATP